MRYWWKKLDDLVLIVVCGAAVTVSIFSFFGVLDNVEFFKQFNYVVAIFGLLSLVGLHLAGQASKQEDFRNEYPRMAEQIISSLRGVSVVDFKDAAEQEEYLAKRILEAKQEVCDLSWKESLGRGYQVGKRAKTHRSYEESISKIASQVVYREIFVFSDARRVEKLKRRIRENASGYSCRYFDMGSPIPRLQFVLIDGEEVVFASSSYPRLCAIRHQPLAAIFKSHYDEAWDQAIRLKDGKKTYPENLSKVLSSPTSHAVVRDQ